MGITRMDQRIKRSFEKGKLRYSKKPMSTYQKAQANNLPRGLNTVYFCYDCNGKVEAFILGRNSLQNLDDCQIYVFNSSDGYMDENKFEAAISTFVKFYDMDPNFIDICRADMALSELKDYVNSKKFNDFRIATINANDNREKQQYIANYGSNKKVNYYDVKPIMTAVKNRWCEKLRCEKLASETVSESEM